MGRRDVSPLEVPILSDWRNEVTVLSLLLNREDLQPWLLSELAEDDFDHPTNRWVFNYVRDQFRQGKQVGYHEVIHALTKAAQDQPASVVPYDGEAVTALRILHTEVFDDGRHALEWLKQFSMARKLQVAAKRVLTNLRVGADGSPPRAKQAAEYLMKVAAGAVAPSAARKIYAPEEWAQRTWDYIMSRMNPQGDANWYFPLGLGGLDRLLAAEPGDLLVIAGPSGKGKSALACHIATVLGVEHGIPTLYGNTEMRLEKFGVRFYAKLSGRDAFKIRSGNLSPVELADVENAKVRISQSQLLLSDALTDVDLEATVAVVRQFHMQRGIRVFVWDHMLRAAGGGEREWQELTEAARTMKKLAQELEILVIMLTQLNDEGQLAGSRRMKQEMDILMFLIPWDPDPYEELTEYEREVRKLGCNAWLAVEKGRDTPADGMRFPLRRNLATMDHEVLDVDGAIGRGIRTGKKSSRRK